MRLTPLLILLLSVRALLPPTAAHAATAADAADPQPQQQLEHHASQLERAPSSLLDDVSSTARRTPLPSGTVCPNCLSHHHNAHHNHAHHNHHHMHGHSRGAAGGGGAGGGGGSVTQDKDYLRLEAIKHQILSKLGLASKPNITSAVSKDVVLKTIRRAQEMSSVDGDGDPQQPFGSATSSGGGGGGGGPNSGLPNLESESDDYFGRTSEIIAFAEPGHTLNGQQLLEFAPPQGVEGPELRVKSATLWVRVEPSSSLSAERLGRVRDRNLTLWIFRVSPHRLANTTHLSGKDFDEHTEVSASLSVPMSALGWQKFEVTTTVAGWYARGLRDRLRLLVDCSGCEQLVAAAPFAQGQGQGQASASASAASERPFLVVHTEPAVARRVRRRALECSGGVKQCCKQRFFVSFKQLGWEDWIIAPTGYFANYCKGDCGGVHRTPDTYLNYYTHVIEEYRKLDKLSGIQPCCAPLKFSSMSLIYFGPDSNIIKRDLPKMVVDECGCP